MAALSGAEVMDERTVGEDSGQTATGGALDAEVARPASPVAPGSRALAAWEIASVVSSIIVAE